MRIGILTFVNASNYGAVLQAYASQKFLNDMGYNAELINYTPLPKNSNHTAPGIFYKIKNKILLIKHPFKLINSKKKNNKFNKFKNMYLKISPNKYAGEISELKEPYDIIIAGSDQIWNTDLSFASETFFLNFKTSAKKTGYAISVGREKYSELDCRMIHENIGNFEKLSVRENSLKEYLQKHENVESQVVCDPVFLLDKKVWDNISLTPKKSNYILVYAMEYNETLVKIINKLKNLTQKEVFFLYGGGNLKKENKIPGKRINGIGPEEFIGWIKNADIVLTNSFHGAAFSIIFKRKLFILEHASRNERLTQLADICGYKNRMIKINSNDFEPEKYMIDSNTAYKNLNTFIKQSKDYMLSICREYKNE